MRAFNRYGLGVMLSAIVVAILGSSCSKGGNDGETISPAAITDLAVDSIVQGTAYLSWTATGDDGNSGTASSYDMRIANDSVSLKNNWSTATAITGEPAPLVAGSLQTFEMSGLNAGTEIFAGIKVIDDRANVSGLSNIVAISWSRNLGLALPDFQTASCNSVALPLTIENFEGVSGVQIYIAYDASHVTFDSASSSVMTDMTVSAASGVISLIWADMSLTAPLSLDDGDTLVLFHFSNLTDPSALTFQSQTKVVDADAAYFTIEKTNGSMTCTGK